MMDKFTQRRKLIHDGLNSLPGVECSLPGGAFYAFPKVIGTGMNGGEFCRRAMHEAGVAKLRTIHSSTYNFWKCIKRSTW
jgi:aspartate/methionine/tyrosine aminotransferase